MPFERPTLTEIVNRINSDIETRLSDVGILLRRSVLKIIGRVVAGAVHSLYGFIDYQAKQIFILTADTTNLDKIATEYGKIRTAATYATGTGTATGTAGTAIPANTELQSSASEVYLTDEEYTIESGGTVTISFTAEEAGLDGNDDGSITLTFVNPIANINTSVTVSADGITGGADEETDDTLRERLLIRKRLPPHGGCEYDYEAWAKEISGVTRAWSLPNWNGLGTIGLAFVRDNDTTIIPNAIQRAAMATYIYNHDDPASGETIGLPITAWPGFTVITLTELNVNLTIQLDPNTTTVQNQVETEIEALLLSDGGPGETVALSRISEAISAAVEETRHKIVSPTTDIAATYNQVHVLGTITWQAYS